MFRVLMRCDVEIAEFRTLCWNEINDQYVLDDRDRLVSDDRSIGARYKWLATGSAERSAIMWMKPLRVDGSSKNKSFRRVRIYVQP